MKYLKKESFVTVGTNTWSLRSWRILLAIVLLAAAIASAPAQSALAGSGEGKGNHVDVTFTKWATSPPTNYPSLAGVSMAGVVDGAVGEGDFAGKVLRDDTSDPGFWRAIARYEFSGEDHSFTAIVYVTQNHTAGTATITGLVTKGWMKGAIVTGGYQVKDPCPIETPGNISGDYGMCFVGTLQLSRGVGR